MVKPTLRLLNRVCPLLLLLSLAMFGRATELQPFTSDGCSAFPDGTLLQNKLWLSCCVSHDYAYWQGGSYAQRQIADEDLKTCVAQLGQPQIAYLMLAGVRVGGSPFWPTTFRWGYGWAYPRFYGELSPEELLKVQVSAAETVEN